MHEEKIARRTRKLEKQPAWSFTKCSESDEEEETSIQGEASNEQVNSKKGDNPKIDGPLNLVTVEQIQDLIVNAVKVQLKGGAYRTNLCTKPYTKKFNALCMPCGYQPPKFQQFDCNGNSKQHVAYFIKTCDSAGTHGDLIVKQFVQTLKGIAFDCYSDLKPVSINN